MNESRATGIEILTSRLRLDRLRLADAEALFEYRSDPAVHRYQGWAPTRIEEVRRFLADLDSVEFDTPGTWFQLAIRERESGRLLGDVGLHFLEASPGQVEIGYSVAPPEQGKGIGSEAVAAVLDSLFQRLGKHRVRASVDPRNAASIALLRRVGMRQEAHFRQSLLIDGEWVDDVIFAVLGAEWLERARAGGEA